MNQKTIYLNLPQMMDTKKRIVHLRDLGEIWCSDAGITEKAGEILVADFKNETGKEGFRTGKVIDLVERIETLIPDSVVTNLGESSFVIRWKKEKPGNQIRSLLKASMVILISFFGAAFTIMAFHNDSGILDIFSRMAMLATGNEKEGMAMMKLLYSIGLSAGILVFYDHLSLRKSAEDPSPLENSVRMYEEDLAKTRILLLEKEKAGGSDEN